MNRLVAKECYFFSINSPFPSPFQMQNILKLRHLHDIDHHLSHLVIITEMHIHNFSSCLGRNVFELYGVFYTAIWIFGFHLARKSMYL